MSNNHTAHVYRTLKEWIGSRTNEREARRTWKEHIARHGNVPIVLKCTICSGQYQKDEVKHGRFNPRRPSKRLRDEDKAA